MRAEIAFLQWLGADDFCVCVPPWSLIRPPWAGNVSRLSGGTDCTATSECNLINVLTWPSSDPSPPVIETRCRNRSSPWSSKRT